MPGKMIQCLKKTKTENPLVLIDEVITSWLNLFLFLKTSISFIKYKEDERACKNLILSLQKSKEITEKSF